MKLISFSITCNDCHASSIRTEVVDDDAPIDEINADLSNTLIESGGCLQHGTSNLTITTIDQSEWLNQSNQS